MWRADIEVPNCAVNMNYRAQLACYPRGNLSPLNNCDSTFCSRVTWTYFRNCSRCPSHSKASLCSCTLHPISIRIEETFVRLRYSLASNRPSQTSHHALSRNPIREPVRNKHSKEWYYTVDSTIPDEMISKSPTYSVHPKIYSNAKLK